jgi:hypothetical protein
MDIELLNSAGDVITRIQNVRQPEQNFNQVWKSMYNATSWRGYVPPLYTGPTLDEVIAESLTMIDAGAGQIRMKYFTSVPGQETSYQEKASDANAYKSAGYPSDITPYPWLASEVVATGKTAVQAADDILAAKALWTAKGSQIEGERMLGKTSVKNATTIAGALNIRNTTLRNLQVM